MSRRAWGAALLDWYDVHKRAMPWRDRPTPYRVWVSEMMLQQTQVDTVRPYFARFLKRFPSIKALAEASETDVLKHWEGLGYYSRARNLHKAAKAVRRDHGGRLPDSYETLQTLPGIGPYCAAAIASIVYGHATPVIDGNVIRFASRLWMIDEDLKKPAHRDALYERLETLIPAERPGDFNQAMMEVGALICRPKSPDCAACPVARFCAARKAGVIEAYPRVAKAKTAPLVAVSAAWIRVDDKVLLVQRPPTGLLASMWELPGGRCARKDLEGKVRAETGHVAAVKGRPLAKRDHAFSHFKISVTVYRADVPAPVDPSGRGAWIRLADLDAIPMAVVTRRLVEACLE